MGSVDTSLSDFVTIIVKAPNQQIADQTIKCHLNWSIKKLKDYLSQVYPSKPKLEEQKLIYSGKLLTDTAILKDVLRTYEGQENHTVHLVCASKMNTQKTVKKPTPRSDSTDSTSSHSSNTQAVNQENDHTQSQTSSQNTPTFPFNGSSAPFFGSVNPNQLPSMNNFDTRFIWSGANAFGGVNDINANQLAMMQQAYAQYISQYMQMIGQPGLGYMTTMSNPLSRTPSQSAGILFNNANNNVNNFNNLPRVRPPLVEEDVPDPPAPAVGAVGNDLDDDENRNNRDWLDWFYVLSRVVVLFSVVYFYSTPLRLLVVLVLLCMFYWHQNMRLQNDQFNANNNNNDNNIANHNNNQNNDNVNNHQNDDRVNPPPSTTPPSTPEDTNGAANEHPPNETPATATTPLEPTPPIQERLSPIAVAVLAIRTFFLSLVPDQPVV